MQKIRLSIQEQQKLYQAVLIHERKYWKWHADSVLASICDVVTYPHYLLKTGKSPSDLRFMEEGIQFKETYARMRCEYLQLKRRKVLEVRKKGDVVLIKLTNKGYLRMARRMLCVERRKLADGQNVFISFDIQEHANQARDAFRNFLKSSAFTMLQQSMWKTDLDVRDALTLVIRELGISKWVSLIVGVLMET